MSSRFGASSPRYILKIKGLEIETKVVSYHAIEGISEPFEVNLTIATSEAYPLSFEKISESEALFSIYSYEDSYGSGTNTRYFHGVINKLKYAGRQGPYCLYRVRMVPYLWFLNLSQNSRIYQNKTIEQICTDILDKSKMQGKFKFILNTPKNKEPKSYCVQYNESNFDFVARILEEAGIFYFFEHTKENHQVLFTDMTVHCDVIKGDDEIPLGHPNKDNPNQETVIAFNLSERFVTGKFSHTSYNYNNASQKLDVTKEDGNPGPHENYIHDGSYESEADGEIIASIRLQEATLLEQRAKGISSCARFTPGYKFSLDSDVNSEFVDEYILLAVEHKGEQPHVLEEDGQASDSPEYENGFLCVPSDTQIRPPRITPKPVICGLQSAIVTGPKGEVIHTDKYGRVSVQFHWDRLGKHDDNSSCWLRVAQTWGGNDWGSQFIPRIGDEVLVDFLEGDPDRPIVTGCVYNSDNLPINNLEKSKTQSGFRTKTHKGEGFNELRFDDANGAQEVYLQAEKDFNVLVKNNRTETVYINKAESIGVAKELTIGAGYAVTVGGAMNTGVGLGQFEEVGLNKSVMVGKNFNITAGDSFSITCGKSTFAMDKSGNVTINGAKFDFEASGPVQITGDTVDIN